MRKIGKVFRNLLNRKPLSCFCLSFLAFWETRLYNKKKAKDLKKEEQNNYEQTKHHY